MTPDVTAFRSHLRRELPKLYAFAYQMCSSRKQAFETLQRFAHDILERPNEDLLTDTNLFGAFARYLDVTLERNGAYTFDSLDETLRSDITRPIQLSTLRLEEDPAHVHLLLWELKRSCLTAVLACLPPAVRLSFVITDLLGFSPKEGADLLQIKESAYRVRLTRARKRVEDYLTPRCHHVDKQNPCSCSGRLMIAIDSGFVSISQRPSDVPHEAHDASSPIRDTGALYRSLPSVEFGAGELDALLGSDSTKAFSDIE